MKMRSKRAADDFRILPRRHGLSRPCTFSFGPNFLSSWCATQEPMGPDTARPGWVVLVIGAAATISLAIGIIAYRDFTSLGHWNPGPKSIVVCFVAAGFGILGLGAAMLFTALGQDAAQLGSLPVGMGLSSGCSESSRCLPGCWPRPCPGQSKRPSMPERRSRAS